ncbi:hypothetical protein BJV38_002141 [Clostridium beijerinckii]|uniref:hypothetical protein n=1 Tax=Clostridium beijerinckii TaxID=1520 RepID=UPI0015704548|nr:hypothetical protein [Clostridium beijerinckii]NRT35273.1 hypothetical protein [Clostridium beijerinckii]NRT45298.1 hypothetical protein [Clostridium beijerinckii]NRZ20705.1 hypothetical protein [Clostridium beijerinckii]
MAFLDEKIAQLQKQALIAKKYNASRKEMQEKENTKIETESIRELTQEEVTEAIKTGLLKQNEEELTFKKQIFFEGNISIPILKDFFDEYVENESTYCWSKKHVFSILLSKTEFKEEIININDFLEKFKGFFKRNDVYIEFLSADEYIGENYIRYTIDSRMPTALDYIYQYITCVKYKNEIISLIFTCLEENKNEWQKIMVGISDLMEIHMGDIKNNE